MGLKDKLEKKIKSVNIQSKLKEKSSNYLSGFMEDIFKKMDKEKNDKLKLDLKSPNSSFSSKGIVEKNLQNNSIEFGKNTLNKMTSSIQQKSFSTPVTKSQIENFKQKLDSNLSGVRDLKGIGKGGNEKIKSLLKDKLNQSIDKLSNKITTGISSSIGSNPIVETPNKNQQKWIKDIFGSGSNKNVTNHPLYKQQIKEYENKTESLSFGKENEPHLIFEPGDVPAIDTVDSEGNLNGRPKEIEISGKTYKFPKNIKLPIRTGELSTQYSVNFEDKTKLDITSLGASTLSKLKESTKIFGDIVSRTSGVTINPNKEKVFTGIDKRQLQFEFTLTPKNETESTLIDNIIFMFKYFSLPDLASGGMILTYPYQWTISYNDGVGGTSGVSFKTKSCYCQKIDVLYGSNEGYMLFKTTNKPTTVKISLSFIENACVFRDDLGNYGGNNNGGLY